MDFHCLLRRVLHALCKKNKIPANMTNVVMADALQALQQTFLPLPIDPHNNQSQMVSDISDQGGIKEKHEIPEVRGTLKVIASTGRFWHDWDKLKSMLSFQLKQVVSEYPEAKMTNEQQIASLGETFPELVNRLDQALLDFINGPPFTLQRLCEILLDSQIIYPNLSKLALALEKNLLVTSTLTSCTEPSPQSETQDPREQEKTNEECKSHSDTVQNGIEPLVGDKDEVMTEVEEGDVGEDMTIDMEAFDDVVKSSELSSNEGSNS